MFEHPTPIVEMLSESTQAFDRGARFAAYRSLASLREYLLIDPDLRTVELFRRNAAGLFELHGHTGLDTLELASLRLTLPQAELFEGLDEAAAGRHRTDPRTAVVRVPVRRGGPGSAAGRGQVLLAQRAARGDLARPDDRAGG